MKKKRLLAVALILFFSIPASARETVTIIYQNDLHGWLFPSSNGVGMGRMARILISLLEKEPSSFYAVSGDLFTGPNLPDEMKGASELIIWNHFCKQLAKDGFGHRVLISAGNHEFDYGVPTRGSFVSGLLCANLLTQENRSYYVPYKVINTGEGLKVGFLGLVLERNRRVLRAAGKENLKVVSMLSAAKRFIPEMGKLDLTVLMIHDHMPSILGLAQALPSELGVDMILSGHDHEILEEPLVQNGIYILQAGALNRFYGQADLIVEGGKIISLKNQVKHLEPSAFERVMMRVKEKADELNGSTVAILKQSLLGAYLRGKDNSLGNFVTDAFRWGTGTDVAMTNSGSLRMDYPVYPGESFELKEGHFKTMTPFGNFLMKGELTGAQVMQILEGEAIMFRNQVSGLTYRIDLGRPEGMRILEAKIGGVAISLDRVYTLTHNSFCASSERMEKYLHLKPGSIKWEPTNLLDYEVLIDYARQLKVVDYPSGGEGRIVIER